MGEIIEIFCKECNYRKGFSLGVGMVYYSLENVLSEVPPANRKEIKDIIHNHEVLEEGGWHTLFRCVKCNELYERFYVKIDYVQNGEKKRYETHHWCSKCHLELFPVYEDKEVEEDDGRDSVEMYASILGGLSCPKCNRKSLSINKIGYWD
jgi:hypothetical protein